MGKGTESEKDFDPNISKKKFDDGFVAPFLFYDHPDRIIEARSVWSGSHNENFIVFEEYERKEDDFERVGVYHIQYEHNLPIHIERFSPDLILKERREITWRNNFLESIVSYGPAPDAPANASVTILPFYAGKSCIIATQRSGNDIYADAWYAESSIALQAISLAPPGQMVDSLLFPKRTAKELRLSQTLTSSHHPITHGFDKGYAIFEFRKNKCVSTCINPLTLKVHHVPLEEAQRNRSTFKIATTPERTEQFYSKEIAGVYIDHTEHYEERNDGKLLIWQEIESRRATIRLADRSNTRHTGKVDVSYVGKGSEPRIRTIHYSFLPVEGTDWYAEHNDILVLYRGPNSQNVREIQEERYRLFWEHPKSLADIGVLVSDWMKEEEEFEEDKWISPSPEDRKEEFPGEPFRRYHMFEYYRDKVMVVTLQEYWDETEEKRIFILEQVATSSVNFPVEYVIHDEVIEIVVGQQPLIPVMDPKIKALYRKRMSEEGLTLHVDNHEFSLKMIDQVRDLSLVRK